jgi:hypothetical protein
LLASILFGGAGATAATAGSEAVNYRCEPNKMADRVLTLHSIITCISQLPTTMEDDDDDPKMEEEEKDEDRVQKSLQNNKTFNMKVASRNIHNRDIISTTYKHSLLPASKQKDRRLIGSVERNCGRWNKNRK